MRRVLVSILVFLAILSVPASAFAASTTLVISQFRTRGPNGANDEFVDIFNVSNSTINLNGYSIWMSDSSGTTTKLVQVMTNYNLLPQRFYLFVNVGTQGYSGTMGPNLVYTTGIPDDGGIALLNKSGVVVDAVGMSASSAYVEGTPLAPMVSSVNQSYERNNGGCAATVDTDNNASDFRFNATTSNPINSNYSCTANPCANIVCKSPPSSCYANPGVCTGGSCVYAPSVPGATCSDGNACTVGDTCDGSLNCVPGAALQCGTPPANYCSDANTLVAYSSAGTCSPSAGCSYSSTTTPCPFGCDGTAKQCKPDPCTSVTCTTPPNGCYAAVGTCGSDGKCSYAFRSSGSSCSDGNACTSGDTCDGVGHCNGGTATVVDDNNPCTTDACDAQSGAVTHTPVADETNCDDGNLCNGIATCQSGACTNGAPQSCNAPPIGGCYASTGTCNPSNGACTYQPSPPATGCDDGDKCTINDQCDGNGKCGGSAVVCNAGTPTCFDVNTSRTFSAGTCQAASGSCSIVYDDAHCDFGCDTQSGLCKQDPCIGVTCNQQPDQCHQATGTCSNGKCTYGVTADAGCDDGDPCTSNDRCSSAGACAGTPLACNTPNAPTCKDSTTSVSFNASGTCSNAVCSYMEVDTACAFGCDSASGLCVGDPCKNVTCDSPLDQCHQNTGTCGSDGKCTYALKAEGSPCDDGKTCTTNDKCDANGVCSGETNCNMAPTATCDASSPLSHGFDAAGACDANGACQYNPVDKTCTAGCDTTTGLCKNDPCIGVTCATPLGSCYNATGTCNGGTCTYAPRDTTASCDDGNACTSGDHCDGSGKCTGTPVNGCGADGGAHRDAGSGGGPNGAGGASSGGAAPTDGGAGIAGASASDSGSGGGLSSADAGVAPDSGVTTISGGGSGSCGCTVPRSTSSTAWPLGLLALSMLAIRRRGANRTRDHRCGE